MMKKNLLSLALVLAFIWIGTPVNAQTLTYNFTKIAETDGTGFFSELPDWVQPSINNHGTVAFLARLQSGEAVIYTSDGGSLNVIADGTILDSSAWDLHFGRPSINDDGNVAFWAKLVTGGSAMLMGNGGALTVIADAMVLDDVAWEGYFTRPILNNSGTVAFWGMQYSGVPGLFTGNGGPLTTIVDESTHVVSSTDHLISLNDIGMMCFVAAPIAPELDYSLFTGNGESLDFIDDFLSTSAMDNYGRVAYAFGEVFDMGIRLFNGGTISTILEPNGTYRNINDMGLNNNGTVVFRLRYNSGVKGIYTVKNGQLQKVLTVGDELFGSIVGGDTFPLGSFEGNRGLNDNNQIAFGYILEDGRNDIALATPLVQADAGRDQIVQQFDLITLDGTDSFNPAPGSLTYSWIQTAGPVTVLDDPTSPTPTFTAPEAPESITLTFELTASNDNSASSDEVSVIVNPAIIEALAQQNPTVTTGLLGGTDPSDTHEDDGLSQIMTEAASSNAGKPGLDAQYALESVADPSTVSALTLYYEGNWTDLDDNDPLMISIWNGGVWEDITAPLTQNGFFSPPTAAQDYVDSAGTIWISFSDSLRSKNEAVDTLSVELLRAVIEPFTPDAIPPAAPTGLSSTTAGLTVSLSWNANSEADLAGYRVYRDDGTGSGFQLTTPQLVPGSFFSDNTPQAGSYVYHVTALDQSGNESNPSGTTSATTTAPTASVHVESISLTLSRSGKKYKAEATVLIHDQNNQPVSSGAIVMGDYYFQGQLYQSGASALTDGSGIAILQSSPPASMNSGDTFTFMVTEVSLDGFVYNPAANTVDEASVTQP